MPSYEASISIAAPSEPVWQVLAAVDAWPQWLPTVNSVQPLDDVPLKLGFRYRICQPKLRPATWVVTKLEVNRCFVWQAKSPGLRMVAKHTIEELLPGNSHVSLRFAFSGLLGAPIGWLFRSVTERYLAQEVELLKLTVEKRK